MVVVVCGGDDGDSGGGGVVMVGTSAPSFHSFFTNDHGSLAFLANSLLFFKGKNVSFWSKK